MPCVLAISTAPYNCAGGVSLRMITHSTATTSTVSNGIHNQISGAMGWVNGPERVPSSFGSVVWPRCAVNSDSSSALPESGRCNVGQRISQGALQEIMQDAGKLRQFLVSHLSRHLSHALHCFRTTTYGCVVPAGGSSFDERGSHADDVANATIVALLLSS